MTVQKFSVGDLVKCIDEDAHEKFDVMRVLENSLSDINSSDIIVFCAIGNDYEAECFKEDELELVRSAEDIQTQDIKEMEKNKPERTTEDVHNDICALFAQVAAYLQESLDGERCKLTVEAVFSSKMDINVNFGAQVSYDDEIGTDDLFRSARIAVSRHLEKDTFKPRRITTHVEMVK